MTTLKQDKDKKSLSNNMACQTIISAPVSTRSAVLSPRSNGDLEDIQTIPEKEEPKTTENATEIVPPQKPISFFKLLKRTFKLPSTTSKTTVKAERKCSENEKAQKTKNSGFISSLRSCLSHSQSGLSVHRRCYYDKLPSGSTGDDPNIQPRPRGSAEIEVEQKAENSTKVNENSMEQNMKNIRASIISNDASLTCSSSQNEAVKSSYSVNADLSLVTSASSSGYDTVEEDTNNTFNTSNMEDSINTFSDNSKTVDTDALLEARRRRREERRRLTDLAMAWDEEELTCVVCDRSFATPSQLERHQQKRRHWGCSVCDRLFDTLMLLEHHKEEHQHWSDDDDEDDDSDESGFISPVKDFISQGRYLNWDELVARNENTLMATGVTDISVEAETKFGGGKEEKTMLLLSN